LAPQEPHQSFASSGHSAQASSTSVEFSLNCPVTASDIPGAKEQLRDGALFFDPTNPDDMADKIFMVCSDMSLRKQLIEAGAKIALERRPENYIAKIEAILDEFAVKRRCWDRNYVHPP
jgi:glycosyltransferase involved in cell wall biosynthesis